MQTVKEPSRTEIWKMFDAISSTYDKVNRCMTFGIDLYWRKKMSSFLPKKEHLKILDSATGTADQIISLFKHSSKIEHVTGIDLSKDMVAIGKLKIEQKPYKNKVNLQVASALDLPFKDESFDCITMSFGIRNVTDVLACLKEMRRVLKKQGRLLILEASLPKNMLLKGFHLFYLRYLLPNIGGFISKQKHAYVYLNKTIETFPQGQTFCDLLKQAGFTVAIAHPLTGGMVTIYQGDKG